MRITFLGTGASHGVPIIACQCLVCCSPDPRDKRLRSTVHLWAKGKSILIDAGPDLRQQVLRAQITCLDAILFTHEHRDHTGGLDEIRDFIFQQQGRVTLYGTTRVIQQLQQAYAYLFQKFQHQGTNRMVVKTIQNKPFLVDVFTFIPIEVYHHDLAILGFRFQDITYITDASAIAEEEIEKIKGSSILIVNALQKAPSKAHFNLEAAITLAQKINAKATYLTHISHNLGLYRKISAALPPTIQLAYDGLKIDL